MVDIYKAVRRNSEITVESTKMMVFNSFTAANNYNILGRECPNGCHVFLPTN